MAEQYSEVINLFDIQTVVQSPFTNGPNEDLRLNLIRYLDGQLRIDGQIYVPIGSAIVDGDVICDFTQFSDSQLTKFLSEDFYDSFLMMSLFRVSGGNTAQLNAALYRSSLNQITYNFSALAQDVLEDATWTIQGLLVPRSIIPTSSLLWSK